MAKKKATKTSRSKASSARKVTKRKAAKKKVAKKTKRATASSSRKKTVKKKAKVAKKTKTTKKKVAKKTKAAKTTKKKAVRSAPVDSTAGSGLKMAAKPLTKSPLSKKELESSLAILRQRRAEILGDMSAMSDEALKNNDSANLSHTPIHLADVGTDNYEQELTLTLVQSDREMVSQIDAALQRIADGTYGICEATGKAINKTRLTAKPWAKYSIEAARDMEQRGVR
ncbi:MAG: TraR/DksA family transcriptional regulator [Phycisphaerae bacterium]|nr:TraR/DksA family transcriptional regulator [Phycisphaerae bacterium]